MVINIKRLRSGESAECCVCGQAIKRVAETPAGIMGLDCYATVKQYRARLRYGNELGYFQPRVIAAATAPAWGSR